MPFRAPRLKMNRREPRPSSYHRGYSPAWKKERDNYLATNQLCVRCLADGQSVLATVVDHISPWNHGTTEAERDQLFWDTKNWQPLCGHHHAVKTFVEKA